jgi:CRISPR/Cas system CMR-associated protein Cmr3 (group 5 of RAMP superfamily)
MTPKEKAIQLFGHFLFQNESVDDPCYGFVLIKLNDSLAKKCAITSVDFTIQTLSQDIRDVDVRGNILLDLINYWIDVKQEIQKL